MPGLVLCAHGTRDAEGARVIAALASAVAEALPMVGVRLAFVEVQQPSVADVLAGCEAHPHVLVPLLLSWGYHVETDIRTAAAARPAVVMTRPLGPDPRLARLLATRVTDVHVRESAPVVLAAAGSSQRRAVQDAETARDQLAALRSGRVHLAFAAARSPSVSQAVQALRARGEPKVAVAAYLLAPGHFLGVLRGCGADVVTEPLGTAPQVVDLVLHRYREGLGLLSEAASGRA